MSQTTSLALQSDRPAIEPSFPVVINPAPGAPDAVAYVRNHKDRIEKLVTEHGAVLLRGFDVREPEQFFDIISQISTEILNYSERSSPRHAVSDRVYTSTDHPPDQNIELHAEQSYTLNWPCFICFFCHTKPGTGGNTPIADNRRILSRLPKSLVERFEAHGILYQRTYTPGLGVSWQTAFQTEEPAQVEAFCKERDIDFHWDAEGRLKTRQYRSAFQHHPVTGEKLWFNHALFFHVTSLEPHITEALIEAVGYENVPTNTFFGNGEPFSPEDLAAMRQAVAAEKRSFDWVKGDVLILDNMICQHGRDPFSGQRRIYTLMARPYQSIRSPLTLRR
ncbi:TauD/TfdA family dioxygenase [Azospirillum sp.]|uniref:TauD/TfdA family dioxygenase n=1 Tax=Azospirillum sp. TaxID=34012 RepID=UPI002D6929A0|nr:TauD/TfdA family dioxygenase [Azospirillum sp.]HYF89692.1 TauD/TfdA family dioxygenase [Azospirillum sp.]